MAPRFASIVINVEKLRDYCLSGIHPRGRHKARVFRSRLGIAAKDADLLQRALADAARQRAAELRETAVDEYGKRYLLDFPMTTDFGTATARSTWIVLVDEDVLRFITCYVL